MSRSLRLTMLGLGPIFCLLCICLMPSPLYASDIPDYTPGEVVVKLLTAADLPQVAADYALEATPLSQFGARPIFRLRITDGQEPLIKAAQLAGDSRIEYAEPNYLYNTPEGQKRSSWARVEGAVNHTDQWAAAKLRLEAAHSAARGAGVVVAVLDTGIDPSHPVFAGRLYGGYDFVDMDPDPHEVAGVPQSLAYGHGTHVAGIVVRAAPDASIMPLRVLDPEGVGNMWVLAEALAFAVDPDGNPATDDGAHVINLSLSTSRRTDLLSEIVAMVTCSDGDDDEGEDDWEDDRDDEEGDDGWDDEEGDDRSASCLSRRGAVVVAAAGNNGSAAPEYPAAESNPGLLAVAATTPGDTRATFSNYGSWVSLGAPGEAILSAVPGSQWGAWSGTSMATPWVAGAAALLRSQAPQLAPSDIAVQLMVAAATIGGDVPARLDVAAALNQP